MKQEDHPAHRMPETRMAEGSPDNVPTIPSPAPLAPISPFEQYNVSAGQGKDVGPAFGLRDMKDNK